MLRSPQPPAFETILNALFQDLHGLSQPLFLVLDDYHLITEQAVHDALIVLLEHLPAPLHLMLSSRVDPPLPLSRYRVRGQLLEARAADLRFGDEETAQFLTHTMHLALETEEMRTLAQRTEGWIAGLQLAALAVQQRKDHAAFVRGFTGGNRYLVDYVQEEILTYLPEAFRSFLLRTAILSQLSAALCQAVNPDLPLQVCQEMLEYAEHANLFLVPLDEERRWYRMHDLFREALLACLRHTQPALIPVLHQRTARWYEARGNRREAIEHLLAAADYSSAAALIEHISEEAYLQGEVHTVSRWLMALPDEVLGAHSHLALITALYLISFASYTTQAQQMKGRTQAERLLTRVETFAVQGSVELPEPEQALLTRRLRLLRLWSGSYEVLMHADQEQYDVLARQIQQLDEDKEAIWRMLPLWVTFVQHFRFRHEAGVLVPVLLSAKQWAETSGNHFVLIKVRQWFAMAALEAGQLRRAYQEWRAVLVQLEQHKGSPLLAGYFSATLAEVFYQRNQLEEARRAWRKLIRDAANWQQVDLLVEGLIYLVKVELAAGDLPAATEVLREVEQRTRDQGFAYHQSWLPQLRVCWWLAQGQLNEASDWAAHMVFPQPPWFASTYDACLILVRVHLAQQRYDQAIEVLDRFREQLEQPGHTVNTLNALALSVVALHQAGKIDSARAVATRLLALTQAEGFLRVYLDAGEPMKDVLQSLLHTQGGEKDKDTYEYESILTCRSVTFAHVFACGT